MRDIRSKHVNSSAAIAVLALAFLAGLCSITPAQAGTTKWVGGGKNPIESTSGDIFTLTNLPNGTAQIIVTAAATPTYLDFGDGTGDHQLLGISGLWILNSSGKSLSGVATASPFGSVTGPGGASTTWTKESNPAGYAGTTGYNPGGTWITLVSSTTLFNADKKTPSSYTSGTFTFSGLMPYEPTGAYYYGIDYLINPVSLSGQTTKISPTGRTFYVATPLFKVPATPEPGTKLTLGLGLLGLAGLVLRVRKRRNNTQAPA